MALTAVANKAICNSLSVSNGSLFGTNVSSESLTKSSSSRLSKQSLVVKAVHAAEPVRKAIARSSGKVEVEAPVHQQSEWGPNSWRSKVALQQPTYPDAEELENVVNTLQSFPPLVFAGEARSLEERLHDAALGKAFLLQGGDCAESFKEFDPNNIRDSFRVLLQMGVVLMFGGQMPVIKVHSRNMNACYKEVSVKPSLKYYRMPRTYDLHLIDAQLLVILLVFR